MVQHHHWRPNFFRPALIGFTPAVFQTWLAEPDGLNLAAEIDDSVVGYTRAGRYSGFANEFVFPRRGVHVGVLAVALQARRQGVGRALFQAVEDWANAFEAETIGLDVSPSECDRARLLRGARIRPRQRIPDQDVAPHAALRGRSD